ncbi:MAG: hypothetical protein E6K74_02865 [Candidatus Eisenbacteria bacterium]|uniref:DUF4065 domain-containing protein n=1 Tax=Eiseniibacteriota bacterium TaxID=2212470 RepID=A0A538SVZ8_UNCEI|nr:MAG: hypothetical protein E6K74_02865 [Candidatus Eisenbacteria bacterium]
MSTAVPPSTIKISGPLTRGDLLLLLYWFSDTNRVPEVVGIQGLSRLTRLSLILGDELGLRRTIDPFFEYHRTPAGGIASADVWSELLALRAYQVLKPLPSDEPMPPEEIEERRYLLEHHIPAHERSHYPLPTYFERDVLTNKGTFFAAKREDQTIQRWIAVFKTTPELNQLPLSDLTARALPLLGAHAAR